MRTAKRTDERVRFMNEIIVGMQVIKMYAWEKPFAQLVAFARKHEIQAVRIASYTRGILISFDKFITRIAVFVSVVTYILLGYQLTAESVFVIIAYFNIMKQVMTDFFPRAIQVIAECSVSVKRIQKFLLYDEVKSAVISKNKETSNSTDSKEVGSGDKIEMDTPSLHTGNIQNVAVNNVHTKAVKLVNVTAKWAEDLPENTLSNITFELRPGELLAIIGPVGSGKTSLLHAILKELPLTNGSIIVGGSLSYASQEPWLFTGSVRQNILFGQSMNRKRYKEVVRVCALEQDFQMLPYGDKTIVGERGVTLSGGQRARINLARAVYKEADIYLLDDPLSAVDTHVGRHLFEDCLCDFLHSKSIVLVTHQLQYLHTARNIVILNNGAVEAIGTFSELQESGLDFARQLGLDTQTESDENNQHYSLKKILRQDSESSQLSSVSGSEPVKVSEMRTRGTVSSKVYQSYFAAGGNWLITFLVFGVCVLGQVAIRAGDYWIAYWTNVEELRRNITSISAEDSNTTNNALLHDLSQNATLLNELRENSTLVNSEDNKNITSALFSDLVNNFTSATTDEISQNDWQLMLTTDTCIYIYVGLLLSIIFLTMTSIVCFFSMCMRASVRLHNAMFSSISRAKMSFFNNNPSGHILNRFTKDMGSVDESLPLTMMDCVQIGLSLLGVVIVVAIVNVWLMIPTLVMFILFYVLRRYYLSTSRSLKRLDGITKSPVFSHLSASMQGLTTVRAFQAQTMLEKEFDRHQDLHSSVWYVFIASNRAFGLWLDSVCLVYITLVTFSFLILNETYYGGDVGLAITQATMLTGMLQWGIRQSAEMENQMTSVERVLEYTRVEDEPPLESLPNSKPPMNWPSQGVIIFNKLFVTYAKDDPPVLKNVNFKINSAEKVGIVGRTGAGKTSLITALFRLVDITSGTIEIDGIDVSSIGLHDLRSKISIIPQEPTLFSGTLRSNLDPFNQYSDATLWTTLAEVEMKQVVNDLPAGLSYKVSEGGSNFSVGQRQLLCLARAIIRNNKILVLDEATANVDPQTDELIQATIRRKFADCTVLTIAHRLHTVMDSDRIIVMDAGSLVEFDHPHILLTNEDGYLYHMVQQTGHTMAESLLKMAHENYEKRMVKKKL
ncbi:probable multidrug resistance-associated protein lethal(2)03659 isoform X2 [Periplaneta americana]